MSFFGNIDFNNLSEIDRSIYHYMSSNSEKIPYMRVREIANESHTSASSVMRFIRKIGYDSFIRFKTEFRMPDMIDTGLMSGVELLHRDIFPRDIETKLYELAEQILKSENIIFFGMGSSGSICEYAARRFAILGCNSYALTDPSYPVFSKLRNTSENMLITLSISGKTTEVVEMMNGFRNNPDFTTVSLTGDSNSTLAQLSDYVLEYRVEICRMNRHEDLTSQLPAIFLIETLSKIMKQLQDS